MSIIYCDDFDYIDDDLVRFFAILCVLMSICVGFVVLGADRRLYDLADCGERVCGSSRESILQYLPVQDTAVRNRKVTCSYGWIIIN